MANFNKVIVVGRLTRDVEVKTFANGGKLAKFGFACTGERKKNNETGKWEDMPVFLDVEVFNRGEKGRSADIAEQYLSKGKQVLIEGHLKMDSWTAQDGTKRNKIVVVADTFQFLEPKDGGSGGGKQESRSEAGGEEAADETGTYIDPKDDIPF